MAFDWTDERLESLRDMFRHKFTASEIAERLGGDLSRNAVCGKLHRLGLTRGITIRAARAAKPAAKQGKREGRRELGVGAQMQAINRRKQIRPAPFVCQDAADVTPRNVPLLDLEPGDCRWPYGEGPYLFCGHSQLEGSSYCLNHFALSMR